MRLLFFVPGLPKPQPRQRQGVVYLRDGTIAKNPQTGRAVIRNYTPDRSGVKEWKRLISQSCLEIKAKQNFCYKVPVHISLTFIFPRPRHFKNIKTLAMFIVARSDIDNLSKAVLDAMQGILIDNDNLVVSLHTKKVFFSESQNKPGVIVDIEEVLEKHFPDYPPATIACLLGVGNENEN